MTLTYSLSIYIGYKLKIIEDVKVVLFCMAVGFFETIFGRNSKKYPWFIPKAIQTGHFF